MDTVTCPHCGKVLDLVEYEAGEALIIRGVQKLPVAKRKLFLAGLLALYTAALVMIMIGVWRKPRVSVYMPPPEATREDWKP